MQEDKPGANPVKPRGTAYLREKRNCELQKLERPNVKEIDQGKNLKYQVDMKSPSIVRTPINAYSARCGVCSNIQTVNAIGATNRVSAP